MTLVTASIDIDAPREKVFDTMLDPSRLERWVTIHRRVNRKDEGPPRASSWAGCRSARRTGRCSG